MSDASNVHYQEVFSSRFGTTKAVVCSCGFATTYTLLSNDSDEAGMERFRRQHAAVNSYPQREAMRSALEAIVAVGPPVRGVDELWSSWQARKFAAYELARAALEVK